MLGFVVLAIILALTLNVRYHASCADVTLELSGWNLLLKHLIDLFQRPVLRFLLSHQRMASNTQKLTYRNTKIVEDEDYHVRSKPNVPVFRALRWHQQ